MENENEFIDIIGYEGRYKINRKGEILCLNGRDAGKIKKTFTDGRYLNMKLYDGKKYLNYLLHRLLAIHFIPNPENKPTVDHIDQNKLNNDLSNLRWATHIEQHANMSTSLHFETADEKRLYENKRKNNWRIKNKLYLNATEELRNIET